MSVTDAKGILTGGDTSVTQFFVGQDAPPLTERFLPIVTAATAKVKLAEKYNRSPARRRASAWSRRRTPTSSATSPASRSTACT